LDQIQNISPVFLMAVWFIIAYFRERVKKRQTTRSKWKLPSITQAMVVDQQNNDLIPQDGIVVPIFA